VAAVSETRLAVYTAAVAAAERRIKSGANLQAQGMQILQSIPRTPDKRLVDTDQVKAVTDLVKAATSAIEKGARLEAQAHDDLINLRNNPPRLFSV